MSNCYDKWGGETMLRLDDGWCSALDRETYMCTIYEIAHGFVVSLRWARMNVKRNVQNRCKLVSIVHGSLQSFD